MISEDDALFAPAKVNLTLHVTGQRADGYHLLDSLVVFADVGDRIWLAPDHQTSITVTGPFAEGVPVNDRNLIWQALDLAQTTQRVTLEKNLPHGAGIGGGSSDAGAILRHFGVLTGAEHLGADVPVCIKTKPQRMQGIGEVLTPTPALPPLFAVLANPGHHAPTPRVFAALDQKQNAPMPATLPDFPDAETFIDWLATQRNDLEKPAQRLIPEISDILNTLRALKGCQLARMSGSGATCFALFTNLQTAEAAAETLRQDHPDWWVHSTRLS